MPPEPTTPEPVSSGTVEPGSDTDGARVQSDAGAGTSPAAGSAPGGSAGRRGGTGRRSPVRGRGAPAAVVAAGRGRRRRTAIRASALVAGLSLAAGAVVLPQVLSLPGVSTATGGTVVTPVAAEGRLVCPGALVDPSDPDRLVAFDGFSTAAWPDGAVSAGSDLEEPDVESGTGVLSVTVPAPEDGVVVPAQVVTQLVGTESTRGLSAAACAEATADSWIVGGSTDVGRTSELVLANASEVAATVDLAVWGEGGAIEAAGATGIVVPAGSSRVLSLAGLAPDVLQPVVRMTARGGEIRATLQSTAISGLTPEGLETTSAAAPPSTRTTIAGFTVQTPPAQTASDDGTGGAGSPGLRILAPGDADSTVTVSVVNEDPAGLGTSTTVVVPAGRVVEVGLSGLADGSYTVTLDSDQPVVAAGRTSTTGASGTDYAWFVSGSPAQSPFAVADTGAAPSRLHLVNTADATAVVGLERPSGSETLTLPPLGSASVDLGGPAIVTTDQPVQASVSLTADGQIASYPVVAPGPLAAPLTVYSH